MGERLERLRRIERDFRQFAEQAQSPMIRMPRSSALLLADDLAEAISLAEKVGKPNLSGDA